MLLIIKKIYIIQLYYALVYSWKQPAIKKIYLNIDDNSSICTLEWGVNSLSLNVNITACKFDRLWGNIEIVENALNFYFNCIQKKDKIKLKL